MKPASAHLFREADRSARAERGIALVVTLILLSVVTFLAVAFLFLARRERGSVITAMDLTVARRAADTAAERAKAQIISGIINSNSQFYYDLLVSTNYIRKEGFVTGGASPTNVNYDYLAASGNPPLSQGDFLQNVENLYYSPRPPVFVRTNRQLPALDFRFYHDLNQSGRFDTNGLLPEIGQSGRVLFNLDTNGLRVPITNFYVGDPEWVGVLEHTDRPHSASNKFVFRYCFIAVPSGKTLDLNSIHNQSKHTVESLPVFRDGFSRNMGVGPWEMNLASFLVDLNTNVWERNLGGSLPPALINPTPYFYDTNTSTIWGGTGLQPSTGTAFEDALALTRYRYGGNWNSLKSVNQLFGANGVRAFQLDGMDGYGSGPLLLTNTTLSLDGDAPTRISFGWPGAENTNHFFTTQDLLDRNKTTGFNQTSPNTFSDRLFNAGYYGTSSYDRYTYYRLLSQLGTDSTQDRTITNKIHLNYVNVDGSGNVVPDAQTNFISWSSPLQFFTNAADRLLRATFTDTNANAQDFGVASVISLTNIPVYVSNKFVYTPALHRVLQVTANIWDSTTNRVLRSAFDYPYLPSVFRPLFRRLPNGDIYINGFEEVEAVAGTGDWRLALPTDLSSVSPSQTQFTNIYGVPWVIGAKKGFPNFNEFAMQSISQLTRKVQLRRLSTAATARPTATNLLYVLGVSNTFAFEAWNSYSADYARDVQVIVANQMSLNLTYTNDVNPTLDPRGGNLPPPGSPIYGSFIVTTNVINIPRQAWRGYGAKISQPASASFLVPLQTNITILPDAFYRTESSPPFFTTSSNLAASGVLVDRGFEQTRKLYVPDFKVSISNRIRFIMIDTKSQRIVDYVQLGGLNGLRDLSAEVTESSVNFVDATTGQTQNEAAFWKINRLGGNTIYHCPEGVNNQLRASLGYINVPDWRSFGIGQASGANKDKEIDGFRVFMGEAPLKYPGTINTNLVMQAPFTPTRKTSQYITWQANDPLVHYTAGDLVNLNLAATIRENPNGPLTPLKNIGALNDRFEPWGGRPTSSALSGSDQVPATVPKYSLEAKDPGVKSSDNWDFPTNKFATLGILGRIHRGTPWQTIYLKANDINNNQWAKWTGNSNAVDASYARPVNDRAVVDVFTTAIDQNTTRGQLNINQTGIAAWSALLGGVIGLTNASSDDELNANPPVARLQPIIIEPAGVSPFGPTNSALGIIRAGVDRVRAKQFNGSFKRLGDILAVPELTTASPLLNTNSLVQLQEGISDAVYERLPQQLLGLMRGGDQPTFTIFAYGQTLRPAPRSIVTSGNHFGLCTNYQVTAEFATRTVVRVENAPNAPRVVVDSFNILPPE